MEREREREQERELESELQREREQEREREREIIISNKGAIVKKSKKEVFVHDSVIVKGQKQAVDLPLKYPWLDELETDPTKIKTKGQKPAVNLSNLSFAATLLKDDLLNQQGILIDDINKLSNQIVDQCFFGHHVKAKQLTVDLLVKFELLKKYKSTIKAMGE